MDTQIENLQPLQTTFEVQITEDKCEKDLNDKSSRIYMMKNSNDISAEENINELADSSLQEKNSHQMKTYSNINTIMKSKFKNINVKLTTSESDKTKTTRISMNEIFETSSGSDEVFQTRYSVNNKTNFPIHEYHSNECSPIFMERTSDKESISENNLNIKTSPIIIQATAYNENKDFSNLNSDQIMPDITQKEIAMNNPTVGTKNRYSLNIATNYSDDRESNSILTSNENRDEQFDFKEISDDIFKDFMNGSFDITRYQLKKPLGTKQSEKQYMAIMQSNTLNKRRKSNYKKSGIKKAKTSPKLPRTVKKSAESIYKKLNNNEVNLRVISKGKGRRIQQENRTKDIYGDKEQDLILKRKNNSPNKTPPKKRNISQMKYKDDRIMTESSDRSSTPTRYPKRKLRNSSIVASRKIKEIEQLENLSNSCEEIISSNDEINYASKPSKYSNSNNILACKANELKGKQNSMLSTVKNKVESEISSEENEEANGVSNCISGEELKNIQTSYKKTLFQNNSENLPRKDKFEKNFIAAVNPFQKYFASGTDSDFLEHSFEDKNTNCNLKDTSYTANETEPISSKNIPRFNETKRQSKHKSWESLETDLLKELDEMPPVDNICKTVILKEEEVIRKKEVANNTNLHTVSNTSMLQTIRKCIRSNKYNMHYEIKKEESKIFESKAQTPYQFRNRISAPYSNETGSYCKSISILDKTIAAMEECTKNLILPQVNIYDYEEKESNLQFEDATDNSDTNHETQFHRSVTFMAKDNKQYYSNEIIGYMKKSKRNSKKLNFKQSHMTTLVKNLRDEPKKPEESDYGDSNDSEHSGQSISVSKNYLLEKNPTKRLCEVKSLALAPKSEEKCNPWSILMDKLDVSNNSEKDDKHMISNSGDTCKTDKNVKKNFFEPLMTENNIEQDLKDTYHTGKLLISVDGKVKNRSHEQMKKIQPKEVGHKTIEPLVSELHEYENINLEGRSSLCKKVNNVTKEKDIEKDEDKSQERRPFKETEISEKPVPKQCGEKIVKKSPKYKLRIDRDGSLKLKCSKESSSVSNSSQDFKESKKNSESDMKSHKHSHKTNKSRENDTQYLKRKLAKQALLLTESSSVSNSSQDFKESKENSESDMKSRKHSHKTNKSREKYTQYLKRKLDKQALLLTEKETDERTKSENKQPKSVSKERENVSKNNENASEVNPNQDRNNSQSAKMKLIAENDDDVFSLSSSDSETNCKKTPGSGLLCDLFDE